MSNIMLTDICNLRCPYCFANEFVNRDANEISLENLKRALDFLADGKEKIGKFGLIGGEPMLHSKFREILQMLQKEERLTKVIVFTNGLLIDQYIDELADPKIHLLINFNPPEILGERRYEKLLHNLELLYQRKGREGIRLGLNIYKPDFEYRYVIPVLQKYGFDNVRFSITVPNAEEMKRIHPHAYYDSIKKPFLQFYNDMLDIGVLPTFDCNKMPVCLFSVEELEPVFYKLIRYPEVVMNERHFLLSEWSKCSPVVDIRPDLTAVRCFGLSECTRVSILDFKGLSELEDYYIEQYDKKAFARPYYEKCTECTAREWEQCMASCMAYRSGRLFDPKEKEEGQDEQFSYKSKQEPIKERFLKCYMKNKVFRGIADEVGDAKTLKAFIEGLEKKEYNMEDIEPIFRKLSEYRSAMRRARDARRVYTEANILEELDS